MDFIWRCALSRCEAGVVRRKMIACTKCHGCLAWPPITNSDGDRRDLRDRALIAVLINTYARITVALKMRVEDLAAQTWLDDAVA
jgi:hypothetical protein